MLAPLNDELRTKHNIGKDVKGVIVLEVDPASPAAEKGVKVGDVIVEVAQEAVTSLDDITKSVDKVKKAGPQGRCCCASRTARATCVSLPCPCNDGGSDARQRVGLQLGRGGVPAALDPVTCRAVAPAQLTSGGRVAARHSLFDTITDSIVPIHNDGYKFVAIGAGVSLAAVPAVAAAGLAGGAGDRVDRLFLPRSRRA